MDDKPAPEPGTRDVQQHRHVTVGQRYRITERWAAKLIAGGCGEDYVAARRAGGVVTWILVSDRYGWDSCCITLDQPATYSDGGRDCQSVEAVENLEAIPS
jgi:hypothetical protein